MTNALAITYVAAVIASFMFGWCMHNKSAWVTPAVERVIGGAAVLLGIAGIVQAVMNKFWMGIFYAVFIYMLFPAIGDMAHGTKK